MNEDLESLVMKAQAGEQLALEAVVRNIQDRVHHLSMRILVNPEDAQDATQEIIILVITKLSTFEGKSSFQTWLYRVAVNYLLNAKAISTRDLGLSFEVFGADLASGLSLDYVSPPENQVLLNELRIACTMAMLLCLDMKHRLAYVLGDILELNHNEAAQALCITRDNFRKRLSRARNEVLSFTSTNCGLVNDAAKCSCPRRLPAAIAMKRVRPDHLVYASKQAPAYIDVLEKTKKLEKSLRTLCLQNATPQFSSPKDFGLFVSQIMENNI